MSDGIKFELCTAPDSRGVVHFTPEGYQIIQSMVMRWIIQCERGMERAKEMSTPLNHAYGVNQYGYWRAAYTFLLGKLTSQMTPRMNLKETLSIISNWSEGMVIPDRWAEAVREATQEDKTDVIADSITCGGGSNIVGSDGTIGMVSGPESDMEANAIDSGKTDANTTTCGESPGKESNDSRVPRTRQDHRRKRASDTKCRTDERELWENAGGT